MWVPFNQVQNRGNVWSGQYLNNKIILVLSWSLYAILSISTEPFGLERVVRYIRPDDTSPPSLRLKMGVCGPCKRLTISSTTCSYPLNLVSRLYIQFHRTVALLLNMDFTILYNTYIIIIFYYLSGLSSSVWQGGKYLFYYCLCRFFSFTSKFTILYLHVSFINDQGKVCIWMAQRQKD